MRTWAENTSFFYRPPGCVDTQPEPTAGFPHVWSLTRTFSLNQLLATDWSYEAEVATYTPRVVQTPPAIAASAFSVIAYQHRLRVALPAVPTAFQVDYKATRIEWGTLTDAPHPGAPKTYAQVGGDSVTYGLFDIDNLQDETEYRVRVAFINVDDVTGPFTEVDISTIPEEGRPPAPVAPTFAQFPAIAHVTDTTITAAFTLPGGNFNAKLEWWTTHSGDPVTANELVGVVENLTGTVVIGNPPNGSPLDPATRYLLRLFFRDRNSAYSPSFGRAATTDAAPVLPAPATPTATGIRLTARTTSIRVELPGLGAGEVADIEWGLEANPFVALGNEVGVGIGGFTIQSLAPGTLHAVRVRFRNASAASGYYRAPGLRTLTIAAPAAPTATEFAANDLTATARSVTVDLSDVPDTYGLQVYLRIGTALSGGIGTQIDERYGITGDSFTFSNEIEPATGYAVEMKYQVQGGPLSGPRTRTITTPAAPVIPKPTGVVLTAPAHDRVRVTWDRSLLYRTRIRWGLNQAQFTAVGEVILSKGLNIYDIPGLTGGTTYAVRVAFLDGDDNSGQYFGQD